jgi:hypothetical protein
MAQVPEGSSPHSQQLAIGTYFEPVESNPHIPASLPKIRSDPILPSTSRSSEWSLSFGLSHQSLVHFSILSYACIFIQLIKKIYVCYWTRLFITVSTKRQTLIPMQSQINPILTLDTYKIPYILTLLSYLCLGRLSLKWYRLLKCFDKNVPVFHLFHGCCMLCKYCSWFRHCNNIWLTTQFS